MSNETCDRYLAKFVARAEAAGFDLKRPGQNWVAARDIVPGSHISLSAARNQIQVNLNNERDEDRSVFDLLYADRTAIAAAIGESLAWEKKDGRKKTAVRATLNEGYDQEIDWDRQHDWALRVLKQFGKEFGRRLSRAGS